MDNLYDYRKNRIEVFVLRKLWFENDKIIKNLNDTIEI